MNTVIKNKKTGALAFVVGTLPDSDDDNKFAIKIAGIVNSIVRFGKISLKSYQEDHDVCDEEESSEFLEQLEAACVRMYLRLTARREKVMDGNG